MKTYPATHDQIVDCIAADGGFARTEEAERTTRFVLEALRERLGDNEAAAVARDLPPKLANAVRGGAYRGDFEVDDLYGRVHQRAHVPRSTAVEQTQIVLRAIGDALSDDTRALLERELPAAWTELLFSERELGEPEPYADPQTGARVRRTLSSGRPGFAHPIAESAPERAHIHSVARSDSPHAETKLSTGHPHTRRGER